MICLIFQGALVFVPPWDWVIRTLWTHHCPWTIICPNMYTYVPLSAVDWTYDSERDCGHKAGSGAPVWKPLKQVKRCTHLPGRHTSLAWGFDCFLDFVYDFTTHIFPVSLFLVRHIPNHVHQEVEHLSAIVICPKTKDRGCLSLPLGVPHDIHVSFNWSKCKQYTLEGSGFQLFVASQGETPSSDTIIKVVHIVFFWQQQSAQSRDQQSPCGSSCQMSLCPWFATHASDTWWTDVKYLAYCTASTTSWMLKWSAKTGIHSCNAVSRDENPHQGKSTKLIESIVIKINQNFLSSETSKRRWWTYAQSR